MTKLCYRLLAVALVIMAIHGAVQADPPAARVRLDLLAVRASQTDAIYLERHYLVKNLDDDAAGISLGWVLEGRATLLSLAAGQTADKQRAHIETGEEIRHATEFESGLSNFGFLNLPIPIDMLIAMQTSLLELPTAFDVRQIGIKLNAFTEINRVGSKLNMNFVLSHIEFLGMRKTMSRYTDPDDKRLMTPSFLHESVESTTQLQSGKWKVVSRTTGRTPLLHSDLIFIKATILSTSP